MKKFLSIILCIVFILSLISFGVVAVESSPVITVGSATGTNGNNVDVGISISNNPGILAMTFCISYDSNALEYVGYKNGYLTNYTINDHPDKGFVSFVSVEESESSQDGTLLTLTFKIKNTAAYGEYEIGILNNNPEKYGDSLHNSFANASERFIVPVIVKGIVSVGDAIEVLKGDVNGDGAVNNKDNVMLQRFLNKWEGVEIVEANSDVTGDDAINNKDLVLLQRYLNKWDVEFK